MAERKNSLSIHLGNLAKKYPNIEIEVTSASLRLLEGRQVQGIGVNVPDLGLSRLFENDGRKFDFSNLLATTGGIDTEQTIRAALSSYPHERHPTAPELPLQKFTFNLGESRINRKD